MTVTVVRFRQGGLHHSLARRFSAFDIERIETRCGISAPTEWWEVGSSSLEQLTCPSCIRGEDALAENAP